MANYVKSEDGYENTAFESKKIKSAYKKIKAAKKHPTSINLNEETVSDLKRIASKKGIPYQALMRMLVIEGLEKLKKAA